MHHRDCAFAGITKVAGRIKAMVGSGNGILSQEFT
jgi:hypothetical protein